MALSLRGLKQKLSRAEPSRARCIDLYRHVCKFRPQEQKQRFGFWELVETSFPELRTHFVPLCVCVCAHKGNISLSEFTFDADNEQLPQ